MDDALVPQCMENKDKEELWFVLILVLMDDALVLGDDLGTGKTYAVS